MRIITFPGRAGWKEIVVVGGGAEILNSSAPATDRSHELTIYSSDALNSPPQQLTASISYRTLGVDASSAAAMSPGIEIQGILPHSKSVTPELRLHRRIHVVRLRSSRRRPFHRVKAKKIHPL